MLVLIHSPHLWSYPGKVTSEIILPDVKKWSAETPALYKAIIIVLNDEGEFIDRREIVFGFKKVIYLFLVLKIHFN